MSWRVGRFTSSRGDRQYLSKNSADKLLGLPRPPECASRSERQAPGIMKTQPNASDREVLAGLVERVTYHNVENGFCVLRAKARGHRDIVTVVGHESGAVEVPSAGTTGAAALRAHDVEPG